MKVVFKLTQPLPSQHRFAAAGHAGHSEAYIREGKGWVGYIETTLNQ
jgi:hypothetical protein